MDPSISASPSLAASSPLMMASPPVGGAASPTAVPSISGMMASPSQANVAPSTFSAMESMEIALRGEVKRLREENADLRKRALKGKHLEDEVEYLRNVTLLQHEEKVPIRLRELERENLRLRKIVASHEEKLRTYESDDYRQRLAQQSFFDTPWMPQQEIKPSKPSTKEDPEPSPAIPMTSPGKVLVLKQGNGPCSNCKLKISVVERTAQVEREKLQREILDLTGKLEAARGELNAISNWVQTVVAAGQQFPHLAQSQSVASLPSFISPTRYSTDVVHGQTLVAGVSPTAIPAQAGKQWTSELQSPPSFLAAQRQR